MEKEVRCAHRNKSIRYTLPMKYKLQTDVSTFEILKEPLGMWDLWVDGMPTLTFPTAEEAAQAVHDQNTGYIVWDELETHDAPSDLSGWQCED